MERLISESSNIKINRSENEGRGKQSRGLYVRSDASQDMHVNLVYARIICLENQISLSYCHALV